MNLAQHYCAPQLETESPQTGLLDVGCDMTLPASGLRQR
jgi:hypothetical protein